LCACRCRLSARNRWRLMPARTHTHIHTTQPITNQHRLLGLVVGRLCQRMPAETRDRLLFPLLLQPLLPQSQEDKEHDEAAVERALTDLHVLVTAAPLLPTMAELLAVPALIFPLLEAWAFARRAKARGLQEAEESLVELLRGVEERAHALLVDGFVHLLGLDGTGRRVAFVAGGTGGIARRVREEEGEGQEGGGESSSELAAALGEALGMEADTLTGGLGPGWLGRRLQRAETAAEDVVALLRLVGREGAVEEGAGGMVPGRVVERLMLAYLGLKVRGWWEEGTGRFFDW
jgi:hypothetical protein